MIFEKIDVLPILHGHIATLRDNSFGAGLSRSDAILFGCIPAAIAIGTVGIGFRFRQDAVNGFLNVFSILTGLLLNLLVLVLTLSATKAPENVDVKRRARLIREIFANICYAVLVAVVVVCIALFALSYMRSIVGATTGPWGTFSLAFLTVNFIFTLVMVLKRMFVLIDKDLGSQSQQKAA